jgi:hypothetical protein
MSCRNVLNLMERQALSHYKIIYSEVQERKRQIALRGCPGVG